MNSRSRQNFQLIWMILVILCAFTAVFSTLFVSCTRAKDSGGTEPAASSDNTAGDGDTTVIADEDSTDGTEIADSGESADDTRSVALAETADMGEAYLSAFVFLGDSTTYGLASYDALPFTQVWTPESGTFTLANQSYTEIDYYGDDGSVRQMSIAEAAALRQPEYLVITLGINGISFMTEDEFKTEYADLIETVRSASPNTKIICQSIFPVIDEQVPAEIQNDCIDTANTWVLDIAAQTGVRYLNTCETLKDDTGGLRSDYCNGDGTHLNADGCQAVLQYVRTHGYV